MRVAVTGSRYGPELGPQRVRFRHALLVLLTQARKVEDQLPSFDLWHGACRGVDEYAHRLILPSVFPDRVTIHALPGYASNPNDHSYRMNEDQFNHPGVFVAAGAPYGTRNAELVKACDVLVACPKAPENHPSSKRSGTWQTVRMARARRRPVILVRPDGSIEIEGGTVNDSP